MAEDEEQRTDSLLPYNEWTEEALRHVVASAVAYAAEHGLPGDHHFYITFRTNAPGVAIPAHIRAQYPEVMTIVLQHQFWDLTMDPVAEVMSVGLSFGGIPTTLVIPLAAITAFADPQVRFSLQFRPLEGAPAGPAPDVADPAVEPASDAAKLPEEPAEVVSLDAFRRRPPPKS